MEELEAEDNRSFWLGTRTGALSLRTAVATSSSLPAAVDVDGGGMAAVPVYHHGSDEAQFSARTTRR